MATHMEAAGLARADQIMRCYSDRTARAVHCYKSMLPAEIHQNLNEYITQASADMVAK